MFTRWRLPRLSCRHLIAAYYSCIYPERMKCWVGLVGWPTADGLPTISGHPSAGGRAQDIESSPVKDQRSSVLQPIPWNDRPTHRFAVISTILSSRVSFVVDRGVRNRKKKSDAVNDNDGGDGDRTSTAATSARRFHNMNWMTPKHRRRINFVQPHATYTHVPRVYVAGKIYHFPNGRWRSHQLPVSQLWGCRL